MNARNPKFAANFESEDDKIKRIRKEIAAGTYFTMDKFAVAVGRMIDEIRSRN